MNREKAEKLLAALVFDDLDASSKAELTAYLQTDDELRERLADIRMTVKVTSDALKQEPDPVLDPKRLKRLTKLAARSNRRPAVFTGRYMAAAAAVAAVIILPVLLFMPSLSKVKKLAMPASTQNDRMYAISERHVGNDFESAARVQRDPMDLAGGTSVEYEELGKVSQSQKEFAYGIQPEYTNGGFGGRGGYGGSRGGMGGGGYGGGGYGAFGRDVSDRGDYRQRYFANGHAVNETGGQELNEITNSEFVSRNGDIAADATKDALRREGVLSLSSADKSGSVVNGLAKNEMSSDLYDYDSSIQAGNEVAIDSRSSTSPGVSQPAAPKTNKPVNAKQPDVTGWFTETPVSGPVATNDPAQVASRPEERTSGLKARQLEKEHLTTLSTEPKKPAPMFIGTPTAQPKKTDDKLFGSSEVDGDGIDSVYTRENKIAGTGIAGEKLSEVNGKAPDTKTDLALSIRGSETYQKELAQIESGTAVSEKISEAGYPSRNRRQEPLAKGEPKPEDRVLSTQHHDQVDGTVTTDEFAKTIKDGDRSIKGKSKTPILGDIPIVGGLLKSRTEEVQVPGKDEAKTFELGEKTTTHEITGPVDTQPLEPKLDEYYDKNNSELLPADKKAIPSPDINFPHNWKDISEQRERFLKEEKDFAMPVDDEDIEDLPSASRFKSIPVNPWVMTERDSLSTFALDVDTASYTLCRRYINSGYLPPAGAVRMEEFINYFNYQYPQQSDRTFKVHAEAAPSPFAAAGKNLTLLKIGVKARTLGRDQQKPAHLVFVIDTSASMGKPERLPLIQQSLNLLLDNLNPTDRITLITCSDQARLHLDTVAVSERERIRQVIDAIQPSGTTNLLAGLELGYATARRAYSAKQINQVVLCSDGVANVGQTEAEAVLKAVAQDRKQGITITCVGVGYGTYNDAFMESLADQGDGRYVFLDSLRQAQRVFVEQLAATLHTVAKDARIQVSFDPEQVRRYRLIGYENRDIEDARFRDDTIDAGEVGSGQCSTALYELELANPSSSSQLDDFGTVFVRYRNVDTNQIEEISYDLENTIVRKRTVEKSPYFYLAATAAQFAEILRQSEHVQGSNLTDVLIVAEKVRKVLGLDRDVYELAELIRRSEHLPRAQ